jgi:hypothetical protein
MNILEVQNQLKDFSDEQLQSEAKTPSAEVPPFLVISEISRRKNMADAYAARMAKQDKTTVAEDLTNAAGVPQGGISALAPGMAAKSSIAQNTGVDQVNMASGGLVEGYVMPRDSTAQPGVWDQMYGKTHRPDGSPISKARSFDPTKALGIRSSAVVPGLPSGLVGRDEGQRPGYHRDNYYTGNDTPMGPGAAGIISAVTAPTTGEAPIMPDEKADGEKALSRLVGDMSDDQHYEGVFQPDAALPVDKINHQAGQDANRAFLDVESAFGPQSLEDLGFLGADQQNATQEQLKDWDGKVSADTLPEGAAGLPSLIARQTPIDVSTLPEAYTDPTTDGLTLDERGDVSFDIKGLGNVSVPRGGVADVARHIGAFPQAVDPRLGGDPSIYDPNSQGAVYRATMDKQAQQPSLENLPPLSLNPNNVDVGGLDENGFISAQYPSSRMAGYENEDPYRPWGKIEGGENEGVYDKVRRVAGWFPETTGDFLDEAIMPPTETEGEGKAVDSKSKPTQKQGSGTGSGQSKLSKEMERAKWLAIAKAGFALMASDNRTFGGALGEAGLVGLESYMKSKEDYEKELKAYKKSSSSTFGGQMKMTELKALIDARSKLEIGDPMIPEIDSAINLQLRMLPRLKDVTEKAE